MNRQHIRSHSAEAALNPVTLYSRFINLFANREAQPGLAKIVGHSLNNQAMRDPFLPLGLNAYKLAPLFNTDQ